MSGTEQWPMLIGGRADGDEAPPVVRAGPLYRIPVPGKISYTPVTVLAADDTIPYAVEEYTLLRIARGIDAYVHVDTGVHGIWRHLAHYLR